MRFCQVLEGRGLLEQSTDAKIDYFNARASRFCGGGVWEIPVLPQTGVIKVWWSWGGLVQFGVFVANLGRGWV